jgi:hypothetical protein
MAAFPLPRFWRETVQVSGLPSHDAAVAETSGGLVKVPIRPKRNPATATPAIKVTAMSIIVAKTGDMAAFFLPGVRKAITLKFFVANSLVVTEWESGAEVEGAFWRKP